jgi:hypothetical protein
VGRWRSALLAGAVCLPAIAEAQFPPVGVPKGLIRLDLDGALESVDRRYFNGALQEFAADLASPALGSDRIPGLAGADARLARITGNPAARLDLGNLTATAQGSRTAGVIGLALGLTSRISLFARLPLARTSVTTRLALDTTSSGAGVNPADPVFGTGDGAAQTSQFIQEFTSALQSLEARLQSGAYDGDPSVRSLAQTTLAAGSLLRDDLAGLLVDPATASAFVPTATSPVGLALSARVQALQTTLAGTLGVPGFTTAPALPVTRASQDELTSYLTSTSGPIAGQLEDRPLSQRGDAEFGGVWTLIDRWNDDSRGSGLRVAVTGLFRLGTGFPERADRFLDLGTGTGHSAFGGNLTTDVGFGRFGARLSGGYLRQLATNDVLRVTAPDQPFAPFSRIRTVRVEPGDVLAFGAHPFVRLLPGFAVQAGVDHWRQAAEQVAYLSAADSIPGVPASLLALDSKIGVTTFSAGITYARPGATKPGEAGLPLDAHWTFEQVIAGSGGRVRKTQAIRAGVRVYVRVFQ